MKKRTRLANIATATLSGAAAFALEPPSPPGVNPTGNREQRRAAERAERRKASSIRRRGRR